MPVQFSSGEWTNFREAVWRGLFPPGRFDSEVSQETVEHYNLFKSGLPEGFTVVHEYETGRSVFAPHSYNQHMLILPPEHGMIEYRINGTSRPYGNRPNDYVDIGVYASTSERRRQLREEVTHILERIGFDKVESHRFHEPIKEE